MWYVKGCNLDDECTAWIRKHYVFLLYSLDTAFSPLIYYLYQHNVIDAKDVDDVQNERTSTKQNERLLSILGRKSSDKIELFLKAAVVKLTSETQLQYGEVCRLS